MKDKIKKRIVLLSVLLLAGLVLAGIGNVLGAGEMIQETVSKVGIAIAKVIVTDDQVIIYEDGKVVQNFTLPKEKTEFVIENSSTSKEICEIEHGGNASACDEEIEEYKNATETVIEFMHSRISEAKNRQEAVFSIINRSSRVQEILEGKEYEMVGLSRTTGQDGGIVSPELNVDGKRYLIVMNMSREAIEKFNLLHDSIEPGDDTWNAMSKSNEYPDKVLMEMAMKDTRVQELLEGKEYEISGRGSDIRDERFGEIEIRGVIVDEKLYEIVIAVNSEKVLRVYNAAEMDEKLYEIADSDSRVQEIMKGKKFEDEDEFKKIRKHKEENNFTSERDYFWKYPGRHIAGAVTDKAQLWYEFEDGSSYSIVIDMNTETVISVEEERPAYEEIIKLRVE